MIDQVKKEYTELLPWRGEPIQDDYNGKAIIDFNGKPLFAELAVLRQYIEKGYDGVWVDNYRKKYRTELPENDNGIQLPKAINEKLAVLAKRNGSMSGCWDLLLWKGDEIKFVELKRKGKDKIKESQIKWLENAINAGMGIDSFTIVEWDIKV